MGLAAAFGLAATPTVLTVSDAEAQTTAAPTAAAPTTGSNGVRRGAQRAQSGVSAAHRYDYRSRYNYRRS